MSNKKKKFLVTVEQKFTRSTSVIVEATNDFEAKVMVENMDADTYRWSDLDGEEPTFIAKEIES